MLHDGDKLGDYKLDPPDDDYILCSGCNCRVDSSDCTEVEFDICLCPDCYEEWLEDNTPIEDET